MSFFFFSIFIIFLSACAPQSTTTLAPAPASTSIPIPTATPAPTLIPEPTQTPPIKHVDQTLFNFDSCSWIVKTTIGNTGFLQIIYTQSEGRFIEAPEGFTGLVDNDYRRQLWSDKLVSLVERMLELHKRSPRTPQEQEMVKREIESTDGRIDRLVYELYGLSEEEIRIVEL